MSYATLTHGEPHDVAEELDGYAATPDELRAAIINAHRRIANLQNAVGELQSALSWARGSPHHQEEPPEDGCTNPGGHEWNRTAGEADEARIARDWENDNIRCVHCGADGDA